MIINSRKDLDAASDDVRSRFIEHLAAGINRWDWQNGDWVLVKETATIERFGFTAADFPNAPTPEKPNYNPDQRQLEQESSEARTKRNALLSDSDWSVLPDAPVADQQAWIDYRQALRDVPQQAGFPTAIDWPEEPE